MIKPSHNDVCESDLLFFRLLPKISYKFFNNEIIFGALFIWLNSLSLSLPAMVDILSKIKNHTSIYVAIDKKKFSLIFRPCVFNFSIQKYEKKNVFLSPDRLIWSNSKLLWIIVRLNFNWRHCVQTSDIWLRRSSRGHANFSPFSIYNVHAQFRNRKRREENKTKNHQWL